MFGKPTLASQKTYSREELQARLEAQLGHMLDAIGMSIRELDPVHGRRLVRSFLRVGARIARRLGCDTRTFVLLAAQCFEDEQPIRSRAQA